jgi:hypothetical protein
VEDDVKNIADGKNDIIEKAFKEKVERGGDLGEGRLEE